MSTKREEKIRRGSRNRQLRLIAEFWFMILPLMAILVAMVLPLIQTLRRIFRGHQA